ncbi:MAG TPA: Rid family detoxifying hydrolase [Bryobacteraceae bacterium]|nr:Rid family detoxifying hydrolase [Bryobacteraceae bacterium]
MNDEELRPKPVEVAGLPPANSTYSQATVVGNLVFLSGQLGIDPMTNRLAGDDMRSQTRQALVNIERILKEAGSGLDRVARCNLYLTDYNRLAEANEVYAEFFHTHKPAKTGVGVSQLWAGALIEIEVTAVRA